MGTVIGTTTDVVRWPALVTANTTLAAGYLMDVDASAGTRTMALPPPLVRRVVAVRKVDGSGNPVVVTGNLGGGGAHYLWAQDEWAKYRVDDDGFWWLIESSPTRTRVKPVPGSYTVTMGDGRNTRLEIDEDVANTLTVPAGLPQNETVDVLIVGTGQTTVVAASGLILRARGGAVKSAGQYAFFSLLTRDADEVVVAGDLVA